jgi:hypothetical protein
VAAVTATEAEADAPLNYADWKTDLLSRLEPVDWHHAISPAEDTIRYVGWVKSNGERAVIAARGAVISPLAAEPAPSWSTPSLAQAVLHDALRPHPAREVCHDPGCPECRQTDQAAATLAGPFAAEVLSHLPEQEFTLSGHAVRSWAQRRLPSRGTGRALNR